MYSLHVIHRHVAFREKNLNIKIKAIYLLIGMATYLHRFVSRQNQTLQNHYMPDSRRW